MVFEKLKEILAEQLDVDAGDVIIGRITEEPWKFLHSWVINYEVLAINGTKVVSKKEEPSSSDAQASEITLTMGSDDFKGMEYTEAEEIIKNDLKEKYFKIKECLSRCGNYVEEMSDKNEIQNLFFSFFSSLKNPNKNFIKLIK